VALWICGISQSEVVKGSFSTHWALNFVLTSLLSEMLDVASYGPHGGKLHLVGQGWYA